MNEKLMIGAAGQTLEDAREKYGIRMGDGFLDALHSPPSPKKMIENESRMMHGKTVINANIRMQSRDLTLTFRLLGSSREDLYAKRADFYELLAGVFIDLSLFDVTYHLRYTGKNVSYGESIGGTSCFVAAKFEEMNPTNRE